VQQGWRIFRHVIPLPYLSLILSLILSTLIGGAPAGMRGAA
jgi:hypothetical protein